MIIPASEEGQYSPHFLGQISMITTTKIPKKTVGSDTGKPNFKYENSFSKALEPTEVVPKKLSICPCDNNRNPTCKTSNNTCWNK